ncbi:hypothetical protein VOLCADRAFT_117312, partial [Volvox carteri f. nagariensis]
MTPLCPTQALGEDVWREMAEADSGQQKRHGDLDSWLDVFRATASSMRNAYRTREALTYESLAFGWLALARKHEPLPCAPPAAAGEEVTDDCTIRMVIRGSGDLPELLNGVLAPGSTTSLGPGSAHRGMLEAARALLQEQSGRLRAAVEAHPQYGLRVLGHAEAAGIAALLVVVLAREGAAGLERVGNPGGGLRATCFSPPAVMTSELTEPYAGCIDSVVYNMTMASREVLTRSELAQALRRSGALGLDNHLDCTASGLLCSTSSAAPGCLLGMSPSKHLALLEGLGSPAPAGGMSRPSLVTAAAAAGVAVSGALRPLPSTPVMAAVPPALLLQY